MTTPNTPPTNVTTTTGAGDGAATEVTFTVETEVVAEEPSKAVIPAGGTSIEPTLEAGLYWVTFHGTGPELPDDFAIHFLRMQIAEEAT